MQYIDFQKQSIRGTLGNSLKTVFDKVYFIVNLYMPPTPNTSGKPSLPQVRHSPYSQANQLPKLPLL